MRADSGTISTIHATTGQLERDTSQQNATVCEQGRPHQPPTKVRNTYPAGRHAGAKLPNPIAETHLMPRADPVSPNLRTPLKH